ncbi:hypothetical protein PHYSODRAFT_333084 [Phytophthora sojae]|uniref:Uncharacterized protein n=1 Tax=Phytophthora sojae (strain P6497) TaxID=1094619 RepID=G4ZNL9_PHYSP|nr:hypothetical protein PHYSODRAFT_333040 [Phytophthora sojae]XP_009528497.1 hypothetical protein PHYSODRAFT_333084 [Phytophthora sojae]EGZ14698.1 hypothetical protein PHYSODRAFT_333040 [Phytophthora sojae]EGZ14748.1 hypothetical protein PHYSODRAFT_333084 [Phytophthora sojae]|eukprot:XP_009528447.1 hypothetical protein PHYSODRAFT_333040 [Phytophthora sojae]
MRCHRGFWVYAGDKGTDISDSAPRFPQEQASQAGQVAPKKRWEGETAEIRQDYILKNPDSTFSLDDNPLDFADGRQDRRRYPRMVRADIATPVVLQEEAPAAPEADGALHETPTSAAAANSALSNYVRDTIQVNPDFKAMHAGKENYTTRSINNLQELYWLGKGCFDYIYYGVPGRGVCRETQWIGC